MQRLMFKNLNSHFMLTLLLASLSLITGFAFARTSVALAPTRSCAIVSVELEDDTPVGAVEAALETVFEPLKRSGRLVVCFIEHQPARNSHQRIFTLTDYLLTNTPCSNLPHPACRRSARDPACENDA